MLLGPSCGWDAILEGFPEEVTFEQRLNVVRIDVQTDGPGRVPGKGNS